MWPGGRTERRRRPRWPRWWRPWRSTPKAELPGIVAGWLDASDASVRLALLKLITGGLRVGASARLAQDRAGRDGRRALQPDEIEEVWHGLAPPYAPLFAWIEGAGRSPDPARRAGVPPADAGASAGAAGPRRAGRARLPGRMEVGRHPRAARRDPGGTAALFARRRGHLGARSPRSSRRWTSRPCSMASCW